MKNVKGRGKVEIPRVKTNSTAKKANSAENSTENSAARLVKTQIPRLGSKFRGPRKTVGPSYEGRLGLVLGLESLENTRLPLLILIGFFAVHPYSLDAY